MTHTPSEERILAGEALRPAAFLVLAGGRPLQLTVREFELLLALARRPDRVITRRDLYEVVWGGALGEGDRSIDVYVRRLRRKLGEALPEWRFIHTHFGFGYRFGAEASPDLHSDVTGA